MTKDQEAILTESIVTAKATKASVDRLYKCLYDEPHGVTPRLIRIETKLEDKKASLAVGFAVIALIIAAGDAVLNCLFGKG